MEFATNLINRLMQLVIVCAALWSTLQYCFGRRTISGCFLNETGKILGCAVGAGTVVSMEETKTVGEV
jgi:hypothetical protein